MKNHLQDLHPSKSDNSLIFSPALESFADAKEELKDSFLHYESRFNPDGKSLTQVQARSLLLNETLKKQFEEKKYQAYQLGIHQSDFGSKLPGSSSSAHGHAGVSDIDSHLHKGVYPTSWVGKTGQVMRLGPGNRIEVQHRTPGASGFSTNTSIGMSNAQGTKIDCKSKALHHKVNYFHPEADQHGDELVDVSREDEISKSNYVRKDRAEFEAFMDGLGNHVGDLFGGW